MATRKYQVFIARELKTDTEYEIIAECNDKAIACLILVTALTVRFGDVWKFDGDQYILKEWRRDMMSTVGFIYQPKIDKHEIDFSLVARWAQSNNFPYGDVKKIIEELIEQHDPETRVIVAMIRRLLVERDK